MVEPHGPRLVGEEQGRAELVVLVVADVEDAGVVEALEDAELARRRPPHLLAVLLAGRLGDQVLPDPAEDARQGRVLGEPVLVDAGALVQELLEHVIADAAGLLRGPDAACSIARVSALAVLDVDRVRGGRVDARPPGG